MHDAHVAAYIRRRAGALIFGARRAAPAGYYEACAAIVYVVDAANAASLAEAWVELLFLLDDRNCAEKAVTVVLNKGDLGEDVGPVKQFLRLEALAPRVTVLEGSVTEGGALVDAVRGVLLDAAR